MKDGAIPADAANLHQSDGVIFALEEMTESLLLFIIPHRFWQHSNEADNKIINYLYVLLKTP